MATLIASLLTVAVACTSNDASSTTVPQGTLQAPPGTYALTDAETTANGQTVPVSAYTCPIDYVTQIQVRTTNGGAAICRLPGGIVAQYLLMAVSNEYENGQPQTIAVFGGYDVVAGTLSSSDMAASPSSIYLSRSVAGLIVNQSRVFEDSVTEVLVDGGGGFPKLPDSPAASTSATAEPYGGPVSSLAIDGLAAGLSIPEDGSNPTLAYCPVSDTCISPYPPQSDPFPGWAVASLHTETRLAAETTRDLFIQGLTETGWHMVQDSLSESTYQGFPSTEIDLGAQAPNGVGLDYISLRIYRSADPAVAYTDIEGYITRDGYCALNSGGAYTSLLCPEGTYPN